MRLGRLAGVPWDAGRLRLQGRFMVRLLSLIFALIWAGVALLGFCAWQASANAAAQAGTATAPMLLEVLPIVIIPGVLAALALMSAVRAEKEKAPSNPAS